MSSSITSTLPGIMQQAYYNSMMKSSMGGGLGTSLGGVGSLGFGGLVGGQGGASVGSNPTNPLQGASALRGLNQFVGQVQQTAAMRKAGLLPSTKSQGAAGGLAGLLGALSGGGGTGGLGGAGGGDPMSMLLQMFTMLQSMMGGGSTGSLGGSNFSAVGGMTNAFSGSLGGLGGGGIMPASFANSGSLGGLGGGLPGMGSLGGGVPGMGGNGQIFSTIGDGFASIDAAINQSLGSIFNTLPLAKL